MVHTGVYATLLEYSYKCGANVNAATQAEAFVNSFLNQAEGLINTSCRKVFAVDAAAFAALPAGGKQLLTEATTDLAAIYAIQYDMSGFTSRIEAEDMINILRDGALRAISILRDKKSSLFVSQGS
jgi:hypothetical protein